MRDCASCENCDSNEFGLYCMLVRPTIDIFGNCADYESIERDDETAELE